MKTEKHSLMKDFFGEDNKIIILPFSIEESGAESGHIENCQKLFQMMGLSSFRVKVSITLEGAARRPCDLLFAADSFGLYDHNFMALFLEKLLPRTMGEFLFFRRDNATFLVRNSKGGCEIRNIESTTSPSKKIRVILEVLSRSPGIKLEAESSCRDLELIKAEPPKLEVWRGLYWNTEAFVNGVLEIGRIPENMSPGKSRVLSEKEFFDKEGIYYYAAVSPKNMEAGETAGRVMLDAGLCCDAHLAGGPLLAAHDDGARRSEWFYWRLMELLYQNLPLKYIALARGKLKHDLSGPHQFDPVPGLNGSSRLQIVTDAMTDKSIDFSRYLALAGLPEYMLKNPEKKGASIRDELFREDTFLVSCLPFRLNCGMKFPEHAMKSLCMDTPFIMAGNSEGTFRIYFPHYFNNEAIGRESYINLMVMLAMLLNRKELFIQNGLGELFKINTDPESADLGEIDLIGSGPVQDSQWWLETLTKTSGVKEWEYMGGSAKGEEIPFIYAGFLNRSPGLARARAREGILAGPRKLKELFDLPGTCKNALLHEKGERNYLFYKNFMENKEKKITRSFFEDDAPVLFVDLSVLEYEGRRELVRKFTHNGCLVCVVDEKRSLLAKPLFPPAYFNNYWAWLKQQSAGFVGISIGRPWYMPANLNIDEIYGPLGWKGLYESGAKFIH